MFSFSVLDLFLIKIPPYYYFVVIFCIILYVFALFWLVRIIENNKKFKHFLANISLNIYGHHINFRGLVDSGNCLYDTITKKPVIILSISSLKKYLLPEQLDNIMLSCRWISFETISEGCDKIPIIEIKNVEIEMSGEKQKTNVIFGLVNRCFDNSKYDCLLHKDYI